MIETKPRINCGSISLALINSFSSARTTGDEAVNMVSVCDRLLVLLLLIVSKYC